MIWIWRITHLDRIIIYIYRIIYREYSAIDYCHPVESHGGKIARLCEIEHGDWSVSIGIIRHDDIPWET